MSKKIISVEKLVKKYGKLTAVDGISFEVREGEIFGLLGENGAGKTTTLEIIEGLRKLTSGKVTMFGKTNRSSDPEIKSRIGVQLQSSAYYKFLTLKEILELFGNFYPKSMPTGDLLEMVNLSEKANSYVGKLSGGQRQRFSIIASLVNDPEIVFLDEPTTGLDPLARRNLWDIITEIKKQGKTVVLTTHYMEEAEILCNRIAIMDHGKIIAMGKTHELIERAKNPFKIRFYVPGTPSEKLAKIFALGEVINIAGKNNFYELKLQTREKLNDAVDQIQKLKPDTLTVSRSTLEDLFIELTGKSIEDQNV